MKRTVVAIVACALLLGTAMHRRAEAQDARVRALILVGSFAAGAIIGSTGVQAKKKEKEEEARKEEARKASLALQEFAKRLDANTAAAKEAEEARKRSELLSSFAKGRFRIDPKTSIYNSDLWKNPGSIKGFDLSGTRLPAPTPSPTFKLPDNVKATNPPVATPPQFKLPNTSTHPTKAPAHAPKLKLPDSFNLYTTKSTFHVYKLGTGWRTTALHCISFGGNNCYPCDLRPGVGLGATNGQCVMRLGEAAIDMGSGKLSR